MVRLSLIDEFSGKCRRLEIRCSISNDQHNGQKRLRDGVLEIRVSQVGNVSLPLLKETTTMKRHML
jgi:hypothetical protein